MNGVNVTQEEAQATINTLRNAGLSVDLGTSRALQNLAQGNGNAPLGSVASLQACVAQLNEHLQNRTATVSRDLRNNCEVIMGSMARRIARHGG